MGCDKIIPWSTGELSSLQDGPVFALETGGTPVENFQFPCPGTVILGNEELGISPAAHRCAEKSAGIVSIPLYGVKGSLNVTAAFAILIYHWCHHVSLSLRPGATDLT
jgi:TrmH family RNA methyltransferase